MRKIGIFQKTAQEWIKHVFECEIIGGELNPDPDEIMDAGWFTLEEVYAMKDTLRNPWILEAIEIFEK
jgi:NADH pyrophosphatase NudC (nudix superfamily)